MGAAPGMDRVWTKVQWATTLHCTVVALPRLARHRSRADRRRAAERLSSRLRGTMNDSRSLRSSRSGGTTTRPGPTRIPPCNMHRDRTGPRPLPEAGPDLWRD